MARKKALTATFTSDFQHEFHVETGTLMRRRLLWFIYLRGGFGLLVILAAWLTFALKPVGFSIFNSNAIANDPIRAGAVDVGFIVLYSLSLWYVLPRGGRRGELLKLSQWLIFLEGSLWLAGKYILGTSEGNFTLFQIMIVHFVASTMFPWTAWQAIRPMLGILSLNAVALVINEIRSTENEWMQTALALTFSPFFAAPGVANCAIRHSRRLSSSRFRHVVDRYGDLRRELTDARRIHEGLFPESIDEGSIRFNYLYQPMRQIGGDFLFAREQRDKDGVIKELSVVLTDVTGHGIAAALTVNRLHGELERVFGENPDVSPGDVLKLLNRYVHLTLARHSVYMTALCLRVRPAEGSLEYASGGHPPAFIRGVNGAVEQLQSTAFVLGACHHDDFDPDPKMHRFGHGDAFVAYTDGATEARGRDGRMLGIVGIQRLIAGSGPRYEQGWAEHVLRTVDEFRDGPPADDTLVVELVNLGPPSKRRLETTDMPETVQSETMM